MRIPITMCHGIRPNAAGALRHPLTEERFDALMGLASEMGLQSINYDQPVAWREGSGFLPERPIMIDFDHPVVSMRREVFQTLEKYGFKGNLFIHTSPYDSDYPRPLALAQVSEHMPWSETRELRELGWHIGANTVSRPNLSNRAAEDPEGEVLREELDRCNHVIDENMGFVPQDFAFTATIWGSAAEAEVKKRYRFGRFWIVGSEYEADGKPIRYAEPAGSWKPDEADGGSSNNTRDITERTDPHRLPSVELQALINDPGAFRSHLEGALDG